MKWLKIFAVVVIVALLLAAASIYNSIHRFDLARNQVVTYIQAHPDRSGWGDRGALIPGLFEAQDSDISVIGVLRGAGFDRVPANEVWARYAQEVSKGRHIYTREANTLVCNITVYVFVEFDAAQRLIFAEGTQHEHGGL